ncbi:MAG: Sec-independent protein translocase protein TatB [Pontixanthobacter sp.]
MFDIGAIELLVVAVVAIIVIGPKDMPQAMRIAGRWVGKVRRVSAQFRSGFDAMVREAEMEDMEKTWKEQNARIMADSQTARNDAEVEPLAARAESRSDNASITHDGDAKPTSATLADEPPPTDSR